MISRRKGSDALLFLIGCERLNLVCRAADLERARTLKVFTLEEDFFTGGFVKLTRRQYRRAMNAGSDSPPRLVDHFDS